MADGALDHELKERSAWDFWVDRVCVVNRAKLNVVHPRWIELYIIVFWTIGFGSYLIEV